MVPNSRTTVASVDQRPGARQTLVLATIPRRVEVGITPHSKRIRVQEENAGSIFVEQLTPLPEAGTTMVEYWALGQRYTLVDDGTGRLEGAGGGSVSLLTGSISFTLRQIPDIGSAINISHGSRLAYTDRSGQGASVRAPEFVFTIEADALTDQVVPGSLQLKYLSGGVVRAVTDNSTGQLAGAGTGRIDYPSRLMLLRPTLMPDAGAQFEVDCDLRSVVEETFTGLGPDAAGFVNITLAQQPATKSLRLRWTTAREVSNTSGGTLNTTTATKTTNTTYTQGSLQVQAG